MAIQIDFTKLTTSWTKYDIVHVMEVIHDITTIEKFKNKEAPIDEPILRSFLGIESISAPIPDYWIEIQKHPREKRLFALLATIFTHGGIVKDFSEKYAKGDMKGLFKAEGIKQHTNIRSALVESGAAAPSYRRTELVPYDLSPVFQNTEVGKLFKKVLQERLARLHKHPIADEDFFEVCFSNNFHKALSISKEQFFSWLQGQKTSRIAFVNSVTINNFFSIESIHLNFNRSQEIYLLGENGDGKSLILMAIYLAFNGSYITEQTDQEKTGKVSDIFRNNPQSQLWGLDDNNQEYNESKGAFLNNFFAYGTHRGRYSADKPEEYGFMSLFNSDQTLINPVSWLKDQKLMELKKSDSVNTHSNTTQSQSSWSVSFLEEMFYDLLEKHIEIRIEGSDVLFKEKNANLTFDQLSEGYRSILIFVSDLLFRLSKASSENVNPTQVKGTVLVDEIDLHLHPKWQRSIVSKLRSIFPNIQFIFTTHSPTIIQGASDDAIIYRVYRNVMDGKTRISEPYLRKDLNQLMINTLVTSPLFGLEDSRLDSKNNTADTSDTYLLYRINKQLEQTLDEQKKQGKNFITDKEIDDLIQNIIKEELNKND